MVSVGVASVPIALFIAVFTGIVLALQASYTLTGAVPIYLVGTMVGKSMILELGPVLTGLSLAGRVGASTAAEVGTMRVTEQIDALETLAYDPLAYLVVPARARRRVHVSGRDRAGLGGRDSCGMVRFAHASRHVQRGVCPGSPALLSAVGHPVRGHKSLSFGLIVTSVGSFYGFHAKGGAGGVGVATTRAVVVSSMLILVLDAFWAVVLL